MTLPRLSRFVPYDRSGRVAWLLHEMGQEFEIQEVDYTKGETKTPEFLAKSPLGKVPCLELGGQKLFDSGAILLSLAEAPQDGVFAPKVGDPSRGEFLSWYFLANANFDPVVFEFVRPDIPDGEEKRTRQERSEKDVGRYLKALDQKLSDQEFFWENRFSVLDIQIAGPLLYAASRGVLKDYPRLEAYLKRMRSRPSAEAVKAFPPASD